MLEKLRQIAARFDEIARELEHPEVFGNPVRSRNLMRERGRLQRTVDTFRTYETVLQEKDEAKAMIDEGGDMAELAHEELKELTVRAVELDDELRRLLVDDDPNASKDVIVEIRAGVGGDEATLFAADLFRMYSRWADSRRSKIEILTTSDSEVGGLKEIIFGLSGEGSYDRLRYESGGHRIQRVPSTESQGRIHTSMATVAVLPEAEEVEVDIRDEDIKMDTFRAGGPGGQNVNKTSSAVRLTHAPSGVVVSCQDESSQHKNRAKAMRVLRARIFEIEEKKKQAARDEVRKTQVGTGDRGERVRTYNVPQNRVTDHRVKENYNLERVLEGHIDPVLDDLKRLDIEEKLKTML